MTGYALVFGCGLIVGAGVVLGARWVCARIERFFDRVLGRLVR